MRLNGRIYEAILATIQRRPRCELYHSALVIGVWNSNSQIAWLIARAGLDVKSIEPPVGGRAPGWRAGLVAATRHLEWRPESSAAIAAEKVTRA